ncbi:hypothetical protein CXR29_00360 [Brevibacterium linens]|nr:hypothetical protein CXR29_00360 [Brevibacterium linens]
MRRRRPESDTRDSANGDQVRAARAFVLPSIDYGLSPHHRFLPGTINIGPQLFIDLVSSIVRQLADAGFDRLLVITGHGGNLAALGVIQQSLLATHPDFVFAYAPVSALATEATAQLPRTEVGGHCGVSDLTDARHRRIPRRLGPPQPRRHPARRSRPARPTLTNEVTVNCGDIRPLRRQRRPRRSTHRHGRGRGGHPRRGHRSTRRLLSGAAETVTPASH